MTTPHSLGALSFPEPPPPQLAPFLCQRPGPEGPRACAATRFGGELQSRENWQGAAPFQHRRWRCGRKKTRRGGCLTSGGIHPVLGLGFYVATPFLVNCVAALENSAQTPSDLHGNGPFHHLPFTSQRLSGTPVPTTAPVPEASCPLEHACLSKTSAD